MADPRQLELPIDDAPGRPAEPEFPVEMTEIGPQFLIPGCDRRQSPPPDYRGEGDETTGGIRHP